jgi:hypothetical protein
MAKLMFVRKKNDDKKKQKIGEIRRSRMLIKEKEEKMVA